MGSREVVASECAFGGYPVNAEGRADRAYPGYARTYRASRRSEPSTIFFNAGTGRSRHSSKQVLIFSGSVPNGKKQDHAECIDTEKTHRETVQKCELFFHLWVRVAD